MTLFWARGYSAASLPDLLEAMGIARSSFYASFGDKDTLYRECLDLFARRTLAMLQESIDTRNPAASVRRFFERTLLEVPEHRVHCGCLMVNSVLELAEVAPALRERASDWLQAVRDAFEQLFSEAIQQGVLQDERSAAALADLVMTINLGLRVQSRREDPGVQHPPSQCP